jgi:predicted type IV restriction endonuclease
MSLENTLPYIIARLCQGRSPNEQAVSQGMVLRVLQETGCDSNDTTSLWPEFQTGEGQADFALSQTMAVWSAQRTPFEQLRA